MKRGFTALALVGLSMLVAPVARADVAADASYERGIAAFDKKDYAAALVEFEKAFAQQRSEKYAWNIAVSHIKLGHHLQAIEALQTCRLLPDLTEAHRTKLEPLLDKERAQVGRIAIDAPAGTPLELDGASLGAAPLAEPVAVDPDRSHRVRAKQGSSWVAHDVRAPAASLISVRFEAVSTPVASADVKREAPLPVMSTSAPSPAPSNTGRIAVVAIAGGMGIVSLALGGFFAIQANSDKDTVDGLRSQIQRDAPNTEASSACLQGSRTCTSLRETIDSQQANADRSTAFYITGGVLIVGAAATFFLWPTTKASSPRAWLAPRIDGNQAGLQLSGKF